MKNSYRNELLKIFANFDTKTHWNINPREAVQILLDGEKTDLFSDNAEYFVDNKLVIFEALAHERGGTFGSGPLPAPLPVKKIREMVELSPYVKKEKFRRNFVDLVKATEVQLVDGSKIPINRGK